MEIVQYNIPLYFSTSDEHKYNIYSDKIGYILNLFKDSYKLIKMGSTYVFKNDFDLILSCYRVTTKIVDDKEYKINPKNIIKLLAKRKGWYDGMDLNKGNNYDINTFWNPNAIYQNVSNFFIYTRNRNDIVANSSTKYNAILRILEQFPFKTIIYNEGLKLTDLIRDELNAVSRNVRHKDIAYSLYYNISKVTFYDENTRDLVQTQKGKLKTFGKKGVIDKIIEELVKGNVEVLSVGKVLEKELKDIKYFDQMICTSGNTDPFRYNLFNSSSDTVKVFNLYF